MRQMGGSACLRRKSAQDQATGSPCGSVSRWNRDPSSFLLLARAGSATFTMTRPIRVLIVDDSLIVRKLLTEALSTASDISVVGTAPDALVASESIAHFQPDVITLDIEMPKMDGLSFLRSLPASHTAAVIVVSSLGQSGCSAAIQALEAGAVDVVAKPGGPFSVGDLRSVLPDKIRAAYRAKRPRRLTNISAPVRAACTPRVTAGSGPG